MYGMTSSNQTLKQEDRFHCRPNLVGLTKACNNKHKIKALSWTTHQLDYFRLAVNLHKLCPGLSNGLEMNKNVVVLTVMVTSYSYVKMIGEITVTGVHERTIPSEPSVTVAEVAIVTKGLSDRVPKNVDTSSCNLAHLFWR